MIKFTIKRLFSSVLVLLITTIIAFTVVNLPAGDPVTYMAGGGATAQQKLQLRTEFGLNQPPVVRYFIWFKGFIKGDLGYSYYGQPISQMIKHTLPYTLALTASAFFLAVIIAVLIAIITAVFRGRAWSYLLTMIAYIGISIPDFWVGTMAFLYCSLDKDRLAYIGLAKKQSEMNLGDIAQNYLFPFLILTFLYIGACVRYVRTSVDEVLRQDYIMVAKSKGLKARTIVFKHVLKNASIPLITYVGYTIPTLISGAIVLEIIFNTIGMGQLIWQANQARDYNVLMGVVVVIAILVIVANYLADVCYSLVDPRIKYE